MSVSKVTISLDASLLGALDRLVREGRFRSRSQAIQVSVREKLERLGRNRLAEECAKLEPKYEQAMAEEGMEEVLAEWPDY